MGTAYLHAHLPDQAIELYRKLLEMDRGFADGYRNLSLAYAGKGQYEEAIAIAQEGLKVAPDSPGMLSQLGYNYARADQRGEAQKILARLLVLAKQQDVSGAWIATLYAGLGDQEQAFAWLEKAYEVRVAIWFSSKQCPAMTACAPTRALLTSCGASGCRSKM